MAAPVDGALGQVPEFDDQLRLVGRSGQPVAAHAVQADRAKRDRQSRSGSGGAAGRWPFRSYTATERGSAGVAGELEPTSNAVEKRWRMLVGVAAITSSPLRVCSRT